MRIHLAVTIAFLALTAQGADAPSSQQASRISDVGEYVREIVVDDGVVKVYEFEEITFFGDLELSLYQAIRLRFKAEFEEGEFFLRIENFREWPDSMRLPRGEGMDFSVTTCTDEQSVEQSTLCMAGRLWECILGSEGIEVVSRGAWMI